MPSSLPVPAIPRQAATVVPVRDAPDGVEVLLLTRHHDSPMSPGAYAFPGGRVEPADAWADARRLCHGLDEALAAETVDVPIEAAAAYRIAALREAFEETGFLLANRADGSPVPLARLGRERLAALRARSRADAAAFRAILVEEGWRLAIDRTAYYARWITPEERPLRYDARFFLALTLPGASDAAVEPDGRETVACRWIRPAVALEEARTGRAPLPVPTREVLRSLIEETDTASLLRAARRRAVRPVQPRIVREEGRERILLPGEPGY